ncbi:hypothetical protein GGF31_005212 [Allomyces arbusculus]|nr:hypothetical protein GGF31_005212 [Allomyces arbusculus]
MVVTLSGSRVAFVAYAGAYTALALVALQSAVARLIRIRHRPRDLKLAIALAKAIMALAFAADGIGHVLLNMPGVTTDAACLARTRFTQLAFVAGYVMAMGVLLARAHQIATAMQLWRGGGGKVRKQRAVAVVEATTTTPTAAAAAVARYTGCGAGYAHVFVWIVYALLGTIDVTILRSCLDTDGDGDSENTPLASSYCHWSPNPVVYTARRLLDLAIESYLCLVAVHGLWIQRKAEPAELNSTLQFAKALSVSYAPRAAVLMLNVVSDLYILWANAYNVAVPFGWLASNVLVMLFVAYDEELVRATLRGLRRRKQSPLAPAAGPNAKDESDADPVSLAAPARAPPGGDDVDGNARTRVLDPSAATRAVSSSSDDPPSSPTSSDSSDDAARGRARRGMYHAAPATMTTMTVPSSPPTATGQLLRAHSSASARGVSPVWARGAWPPPLPYPPPGASGVPPVPCATAPPPAAPTIWDPATMAAAYAAAAAAAAALGVESVSTPRSSAAGTMSPAAAAIALMSPEQVNAVMALAVAAGVTPPPPLPQQEGEVVATAWPAEPARISGPHQEEAGGRWEW